MRRAPIRFGLIGAGVAATTHAREIKNTTDGEIVAVQARDIGRARAFASEHGIAAAYGHIEELLAHPGLDAVIITTPNGLHLEPALAAAGAGKHVIVEKPLEIDEARALRIIDACKRHGVSLHVIYQRRHSEAAAQALEDVRTGRLGRIVLVNIIDNQFRHRDYYARAAWRGTKDLEGGGCVITQATHLIDLAQHVAGPIVALSASTATLFHQIETEDTAAATLHFASGALGTFSASTAAFPGLKHLLLVCGTQGSILINGEHDQILFRQVAGDVSRNDIPANFSFRDPTDPQDYPTDGQRRQLQAIIDRLLTGTRDESGIEDALRNVRVVDAIYRSSQTRAAISLG